MSVCNIEENNSVDYRTMDLSVLELKIRDGNICPSHFHGCSGFHDQTRYSDRIFLRFLPGCFQDKPTSPPLQFPGFPLPLYQYQTGTQLVLILPLDPTRLKWSWRMRSVHLYSPLSPHSNKLSARCWLFFVLVLYSQYKYRSLN